MQNQVWDSFGDDIYYVVALGEVEVVILGADGSSAAPRLVFCGADESRVQYKLEAVQNEEVQKQK